MYTIKCGKHRKQIDLYKINDDGTVYIYPRFRRLWGLLTSIGTFIKWPDCGNPISPPHLPPSPVSTLIGTKSLGTNFLSFINDNYSGPIKNDDIRLLTFSNGLDYKIEWDINGLNSSQLVHINFYTDDVPKLLSRDKMYLRVDRENRLTSYIADSSNNHSGIFTLKSVSRFYVNIPESCSDISVRLKITSILPKTEIIPCDNYINNTPITKCLKFSYHGKKYLVPAYKYILSRNSVTKWPDSAFVGLSNLIQKTFVLTSLPLLLPVTNSCINNPVVELDNVGSKASLGCINFWGRVWTDYTDPRFNKVQTDYSCGRYYGADIPEINGYYPRVSFDVYIRAPKCTGCGCGDIHAYITAGYCIAGDFWQFDSPFTDETLIKHFPVVGEYNDAVFSGDFVLPQRAGSIVLVVDRSDALFDNFSENCVEFRKITIDYVKS